MGQWERAVLKKGTMRWVGWNDACSAATSTCTRSEVVQLQLGLVVGGRPPVVADKSAGLVKTIYVLYTAAYRHSLALDLT